MRIELSYKLTDFNIEDCVFGFIKNIKGEYVLHYILPKAVDNGLVSLTVSYNELLMIDGEIIKIKTSNRGKKGLSLYKYFSFKTGKGFINRLQTLI